MYLTLKKRRISFGSHNNFEVVTDEYIADRTNAIACRTYDAVVERLSGQAREYLSADSVEGDGDGNSFEPDFLHSVNISGIPPHRFKLKKGVPVMMKRNLNPDLGSATGHVSGSLTSSLALFMPPS
ncbi:hypothetical protein PC110_g18590 [Phytophthora cactorum]|nr:hypothetical protein PC110_g18590 [Phytophthora cactorum]